MSKQVGWLVGVALTLIGCAGEPEPPVRWEYYGTEPVGTSCTGPLEGWSDVHGYAFGATFSAPKEADLGVDPYGLQIRIGADLGLDEECKAHTTEMFLDIIVPMEDPQLGPVDVPSPAFVILQRYMTDGGTLGPVYAIYGTVSFDGYDPRTYMLCGSVDILFNDDEGGHLTGSFQAPIRCPNPEQFKGF